MHVITKRDIYREDIKKMLSKKSLPTKFPSREKNSGPAYKGATRKVKNWQIW